MVVCICLIAVDRKHWKQGNKLQTLTQYIFQGSIVCPVIVRIKCQDTSCQCIHHITARGFHDNVTDKAGRQGTVKAKQIFKFGKLLCIRKGIKQKQVSHFFKTKTTVCGKSFDEILYIIPPVKQFAVCRNLFSVYNFIGTYIGNRCQSCKNSLSV